MKKPLKSTSRSAKTCLWKSERPSTWNLRESSMMISFRNPQPKPYLRRNPHKNLSLNKIFLFQAKEPNSPSGRCSHCNSGRPLEPQSPLTKTTEPHRSEVALLSQSLTLTHLSSSVRIALGLSMKKQLLGIFLFAQRRLKRTRWKTRSL